MRAGRRQANLSPSLPPSSRLPPERGAPAIPSSLSLRSKVTGTLLQLWHFCLGRRHSANDLATRGWTQPAWFAKKIHGETWMGTSRRRSRFCEMAPALTLGNFRETVKFYGKKVVTGLSTGRAMKTNVVIVGLALAASALVSGCTPVIQS